MVQLELKIGDKTYNKAWVDNLSSTSQISNDPASVNYGVIPSTGNATMRDINGEIRADIENNVLPVSNAPTKISINGNQVQEHTTSDSDYNIIDKGLSLQFSDRLSLLDKVTYGGMPLREYSMTAYDMLDDVIGSYGGYVKERLINWTKYTFADRFSIDGQELSVKIKFSPTSDYPVIGIPIKVTPNIQHKLSVSLDILEDYAGNARFQILNAMPTDSANYDKEITGQTISEEAGEDLLLFTFTPVVDTIYAIINFGYATQRQQTIQIAVNSIKLDDYGSLSMMTTDKMPSGRTIAQELELKTIKYPYLASAPYRETIEKFCTLMQISMALNEDGNAFFYCARPVTSNENTLVIPNTYKISNLKKTLMLKNKIDGVDIQQDKVKDEIVTATNIYNWDSTDEEYTKRTDTAKATDVSISVTYFIGDIQIPKKSADNFEQMKKISRYEFSCSGTHSSGTVTRTSTDGAIGYKFNYTSEQEESWKIEKFSESNYTGAETATLANNTIFNTTDNGEYYLVHFELPASSTYWYWQFVGGNTLSDLQTYSADKLSISLYGDKRVISFEVVNLSSQNIENATVSVSIRTNELMQNLSDVVKIRDNILDDYSNGVPTATIDLFCGVGDWKNGEIIQPNDYISFLDDVDRNGIMNDWKVTGRTFKYQGAPTLSLELQQVRSWKPFFISTGWQIVLPSGTVPSSATEITKTETIDNLALDTSVSNGRTRFKGIAYNQNNKKIGEFICYGGIPTQVYGEAVGLEANTLTIVRDSSNTITCKTDIIRTSSTTEYIKQINLTEIAQFY